MQSNLGVLKLILQGYDFSILSSNEYENSAVFLNTAVDVGVVVECLNMSR